MKKILMGLVVAVGMALAPMGVYADILNPKACEGLSAEQAAAAGCGNTGDELMGSKIPGVVSAILWIAGILAVGMIIYSAVRMTISQGDSAKIEQEKKTITYAVVGLIITLLAYVIVGFVVGEFSGNGGESAEDGASAGGEA